MESKTGVPGFDEALLLQRLSADDGEDRRLASQEVGFSASAITNAQAFVERLCGVLVNDPSDSVREWAAWALGRLGVRSAAPYLDGGLRQPNRDVRNHCALALARLRMRESIPSLLAYLEGTDEIVSQGYAVEALLAFPQDKRVLDRLAAVAKDAGVHPRVRRRVYEALTGREPRGLPGREDRLAVALELDIDEGRETVQPPGEPDDAAGTVPRHAYVTTAPRRDSRIAEDHKRRHDWSCQVCRQPGFTTKGGGKYTEVHHMVPLGEPGGGEDVPENLLCVCPMCHEMLHHAADREYDTPPHLARPRAVRINGVVLTIFWLPDEVP